MKDDRYDCPDSVDEAVIAFIKFERCLQIQKAITVIH